MRVSVGEVGSKPFSQLSKCCAQPGIQKLNNKIPMSPEQRFAVSYSLLKANK